MDLVGKETKMNILNWNLHQVSKFTLGNKSSYVFAKRISKTAREEKSVIEIKMC